MILKKNMDSMLRILNDTKRRPNLTWKKWQLLTLALRAVKEVKYALQFQRLRKRWKVS